MLLVPSHQHTWFKMDFCNRETSGGVSPYLTAIAFHMIVFIHGYHSDCFIWALKQERKDKLISTFTDASLEQTRGCWGFRDWVWQTSTMIQHIKPSVIVLLSQLFKGWELVTFSSYSWRGMESDSHTQTHSPLNTGFSSRREGRGHSTKVNSNFGCFLAFFFFFF